VAPSGGTGSQVADLALGDTPPLPGEALYHAQQAAEKPLKGFLVANGVAYPLTHDIGKLLDLCGKIDRDLDTALSPAADLTQFAVRFRYPGEDQPMREEALPWLRLARLVLDAVTRRLSGDK